MMDDIRVLGSEPHTQGSERMRTIANWVVDAAKAAGWDARIVEQRNGWRGTLLNVVADRPGTASVAEGAARPLVIAGAHLDSVRGAPGANDNVSGSAALLAMARAFKDVPTANDLRLVWFDGEELGLLGSRAYASSISDDAKRAIAMLNADMIASPGGTVGFSMGATTTNGLGDAVAAIARRNGIAAEFRPERHGRSDHHSFDRAGIPSMHFGVSVVTVDQDDPNYHSPRDRVDQVNQQHLDSHADLMALTMLELGNRPERVPGPPAPRNITVITGPPI